MLSSSADPDLRRIAWQVEGADMGPGSQQEYRRYKGRCATMAVEGRGAAQVRTDHSDAL